MINWKDYLPDFKKALTGFYEESLKNTVETKTHEFKSLLEKNISYGQKTQQAFVFNYIFTLSRIKFNLQRLITPKTIN